MPKLIFILFLTGLFLTIISQFLSIYTMYYTSPQSSIHKNFIFSKHDTKIIELILPSNVGEKIYLSIKNNNMKHPFNIMFEFYDKNNITLLRETYHIDNRNKNFNKIFNLTASPHRITITFYSEFDIDGEVVIRFSRIDYNILSIYVFLLTLFGFVGSLILFYSVLKYLSIKYLKS